MIFNSVDADQPELLFVGVDLHKHISTVLNEVEDKLIAEMNDDQKEGYHYGVNTILKLLDDAVKTQLTDGYVDAVVITPGREWEEFTYSDLRDLLMQEE